MILGRAHIPAEPYDAKSAFVLLASIMDGLDDAAPPFIDTACRLHMAAAPGTNKLAGREACRAMDQLVDALVYRLVQASR